jgi:BirA family biotin operon repressor/biotin-[acetyl-CoA-carboxylase] ligase
VAAEWAKAWAADNHEGLGLVLADEQTAGRGRSGRAWFTPPGAALAMTLILPPIYEPELIGRLSGMAALAVSQALEIEYGLEPQIKWPNDVLLNDAKVAGILPESHWVGEKLTAQFVGLGINIAPPSVPSADQLDFPATCVEEAAGETIDRLELLYAVTAGLLGWYERLGTDGLMKGWEKRLAYKDQNVNIEHNGGTKQEGVVVGLAEDGSLRLALADGSQTEVQAGEIRLRPLVDS